VAEFFAGYLKSMEKKTYFDQLNALMVILTYGRY